MPAGTEEEKGYASTIAPLLKNRLVFAYMCLCACVRACVRE